MKNTKQPKVAVIQESDITKKDIDSYIKAAAETDMSFFSANDLDIPDKKRIISITNSDGDLVHLVNPKIKKTFGNKHIYFEQDTYKQKIRKTVRYKYIVVETDNIGDVEFVSNVDWQSLNECLTDPDMMICVYVQRLIDAINGIDVNSNNRRYSIQVTNEENIGRNERVMLQSPEGDTIYIKYKHFDIYRDRGYRLLK